MSKVEEGSKDKGKGKGPRKVPWTKVPISREQEDAMIGWFERHTELWDIGSAAHRQTTSHQRALLYHSYAEASGINGLEGLYI